LRGGAMVACRGEDLRDDGRGDEASQAIFDPISDLAVTVARV